MGGLEEGFSLDIFLLLLWILVCFFNFEGLEAIGLGRGWIFFGFWNGVEFRWF